MKKIKADLHNHLGKNGRNPGFDETIDLVHFKLGDGGIFGICNDGHTDFRYEDFINQGGGKYNRVELDKDKKVIYVPEKKISVVGVEEVESKQGHFIVVGMPQNKKIQTTKTTLSLEDALRKADDFNGIKIVVHPMGGEGLGEYLINHFHLFPEFNGWEVYNASAELSVPCVLPRKANEKSAGYYISQLNGGIDAGFDLNIGACAFTDGHSVDVIGRSYTKLPKPDKTSSQNFIESLRVEIKGNKTFENLHCESAKWDAFKHCYHMTNHMIFGKGA